MAFFCSYYQNRDVLHTTTHNLADEPTLADGPPGNRAEMPCIPLHKFGRWNYFGWTQWQRFESSSTHHFWDTPQHFLKTHFCLESGFLLFLVPEQRWLTYHYTQLGRWTYFGWTQWQRFESSSTHHFWDTKQHFLKTHFCLESGFLSCLELQKSLLVSFQGCWTQWQRFESSSTHHFWDTCQHFLKTHFCLESGFLSFLIPEQRWLAYHYTNLADETTLAEHNGKGLKALALTISEIVHSIFSKHTFAKKVAFFCS